MVDLTETRSAFIVPPLGSKDDISLSAGTLEEACSARWRSGYAAACKAVYTGSIPVRASNTDPV